MAFSGGRRSQHRFLRFIFVFSLFALISTVGALFVVQRTVRTPRIKESAAHAVSAQTPGTSSASGVSATYQYAYQEAPETETLAAPEETKEPDAHVSRESIMPEDLYATRERAGLTDAVIASLRAQNTGLFYYDRLTEHEQNLYAELYYIMTSFAEDVCISSMDPNELEKVQNCVMNDHPEIFYINGYFSTRYTLGTETVGYSFTGRYIYDENVVLSRNAAIENYAANCLAGAPQGDDYQKIKYIYEYIINHTTYEVDAPDNQNICSVMISSSSVCQGYAKAAQFLLNRLGIECTLVVGTVQGTFTSGSHAWNLVKSNGNWYYLDVTWGDASFIDQDIISDNIGYDYLLTTTADISHTHTVGSVVPMPLCDHMEDNYYVREGAYFTEASLAQFADLVNRRAAQGAPTVTLKCASQEVFAQMMTMLIDQSQIFDYIRKAPGESLSFTRSDEQRSFTVWF